MRVDSVWVSWAATRLLFVDIGIQLYIYWKYKQWQIGGSYPWTRLQKVSRHRRHPRCWNRKSMPLWQHLKDPSAKVDAHLKHWVKQKKFQLMAISESGKRPWPISRLPEILKRPNHLEMTGPFQDPENAHGQSGDRPKSWKRVQHDHIVSCLLHQHGEQLV